MYKIKEFAKLINVSIDTLRNWDKSGKFKPAYVGLNKHRYYTHEQYINFVNPKFKVYGIYKNDIDKEKVEIYLNAKNIKYELINVNNSSEFILMIISKCIYGRIHKFVCYSKDDIKINKNDMSMITNILNMVNSGIEFIDKN